MKKAVEVLLRIASVLLTPLPVWAEADGPDYFRIRGIATGSTLNLRAAPNVESQKLGDIPSNGKCIRNLGCRGGLTFDEFSTLSDAEKRQRTAAHPRWCKVEYAGVVGWAAGRYLAEGDCSNLRQ